MDNISIKVPQLSINDEEATLSEWLVKDKSKIEKGQIICLLEFSKANFEIEAESSGYLVYKASKNEKVKINQEIGIVISSLDNIQDISKKEIKEIKATKKAVELAKKHNINLSDIDTKLIIKESDVLELIQNAKEEETLEINTDDAKYHTLVAVYGAGNGALTIQETLELESIYKVACFIDDNPKHKTLNNLPIIHGNKLNQLLEERILCVALGIGNGKIRQKIKRKIENSGFKLINVIHPTAYISPSVKIGIGNYIKAGAIIETNTIIKDCCIIDNGVIIAHDNIIEDACHLSPGVSLGSSIKIGHNSIIGIGANIATDIKIGCNCIVLTGSAITNDVDDFSIVNGVPAKIIGKAK